MARPARDASGTLTLFDINGANLGTSTLTNGAATFSVPSAPIGKESITAVYSGDSNFSSATSQAVPMVVGSPTELFVNQVFLDVIGSPAGQGGALWVALINGGYAPKRVARNILQSPQGKAQAVENVYQELLRRPATSSELFQALTSRKSSTTLLVNILSRASTTRAREAARSTASSRHSPRTGSALRSHRPSRPSSLSSSSGASRGFRSSGK